jgi:hypothetical protein
MFLPDGRKLLESNKSDNIVNSTSGSPSTFIGSLDDVFFGNSSYNASGEGMADFGEVEFGKSQ